jgi:hypothetical protein
VDREIDTRTRNLALLKRLLVPAAAIAVAWVLVLWGMGFLRPPVKRSGICTAVRAGEPIVELDVNASVLAPQEAIQGRQLADLGSPLAAELDRTVPGESCAVTLSNGGPVREHCATLVQEILRRHGFAYSLDGPSGGPTRFPILLTQA